MLRHAVTFRRIITSLAAMGIAFTSFAASSLATDFPAMKQGEWVAKDFRFHTGETMDVRLHYTTIGDPSGIPVVVLHGTSGSGQNMLTPAFAGQLFGPSQPLDAATHYIVLPDSIGHGKSSKPSDGLKSKFPRYDYADMVDAQHRLLTEGLNIRHVRLIIGNSMGGMQAWLWGERFPGYMDILVPMASQPTAMAARNWMMRRIMLESIRRDPAYNDGNYATQPPSLKTAAIMYSVATSGGTLHYQHMAPTRALADKYIDMRLAAPAPADANDFIWQWSSSADYDPEPGLARIEATVLAINAADDERNPPETGVTAAALKQVKNGSIYIIPASEKTGGHLTTGNAAFYARQLEEVLKTAPRRAM